MSEKNRSITLGIEMSNPGAHAPGEEAPHAVALWDAGGRCLGSAPLPESTRGSDAVLDAISKLAGSCSIQPCDIDRVLVSVGPGGYTALRISTTSAKVLADTLGADLVAVPTARVVSVSLDASARPALIALASKKDRCHASVLTSDGVLRSVGIIEADALRSYGLKSIVADRHLPGSFREAASAIGVGVLSLRLDARDLVRAAEGIDPIDPLRCEPIYAREPDAVTQWRARASG